MKKIFCLSLLVYLVSAARLYASDIELSTSAFGNGMFVLAGGDVSEKTGIIISSKDGKTWNKVMSPSDSISKVIFGAGKFVATSYQLVYVSQDGTKWETVKFPYNAELRGASRSPNRFIAFSSNELFESTDGITWNKIGNDLPKNISIDNMIYGNSTFTIIGTDNNSNRVAYNCKETFSYCLPLKVDSIVFDGIFVKNRYMLAIPGGVATSKDLADITYVKLAKDIKFSDNERQYMVNNESSILPNFFGIASNGNTIVTVGINSNIAYSNNGTTWNKANIKNYKGDTTLSTVTFGAGKFVAAGQDGLIVMSVDGKNWTKISK